MSDAGEEIEARAAALGAPLGDVDVARTTPMLCERSGAPLASPDWLYELKLDGVRILADVRASRVKLFYRKARDTTSSYPEVCDALSKLGVARAVLDGEIVTFDGHGRPSFERLGQRFSLTRPDDVRVAMRAVPVVYVVFDLLAIGARDVRPLPLVQRKELLRALVPPALRDVVRVLEHFDGDGGPLLALCRREKLEGIIAKRRDAPYRTGARSADWVKTKCEQDDDFVVVGWTKDTNGGLGALDLATYDGDVLRVRGEAGSGIDRRTAARLLARFEALAARGPTAVGEYEKGEDRVHLRPEVVVRVRWLSWSEGGRLRFPVFLGVREDGDPRECRAAPEEAKPLEAAPKRAGKAPRAVTPTGAKPAPSPAIAWYEAAAPALLRYVAGRPLAVARAAPDEASPRWAPPKNARSFVGEVALPADARARRAIVVDDVAGIRWLAAEGAIAFFVAAARASSLDRADWLALDLDARAAPPKTAAAIAVATRDVLAELGLPAFAKTAAHDGLHVLAPLGGAPWGASRALSELVVRAVCARDPKRATADAAVAKAGGRVLLRAAPSLPFAPLVAPWSLRCGDAAGAPRVSVPVAWDEVRAGLAPSRFTAPSAASRLDGDPAAPLVAATVDLDQVVARAHALFA